MKIALICTEKLPVPPVSGGAVQIYIDGVLPYLSREHDITVYTVQHPQLKDKEVIDGVRFIRLPASPKETYIHNVVNCIEEDYDLIHVFNRPKWIKFLSRKLPNTKLSLSLHNEMFRPQKISSAEAVECINRVEFINTVSIYIAEGVRKLYPFAGPKLRVVYSGVDLNKFNIHWSREGRYIRHSLKEKYGLTNYRVVLFVGRLCEKKGVDVLLRAMELTIRHYSKVALVIIGSKWFGDNEKNPYVEELESLAKRLNGHIIFTGFLPPEEVYEHYNMADIFVCPSQWNEPLARVHYEAMAAGVPIITTNRGGNAEVVKGFNNGIVIDDYANSVTLSKNINFLLRNPRKSAIMGRNGRKIAEERYSWSRVANDILRGFRRINE